MTPEPLRAKTAVVACWHHADEERLHLHLRHRRIDLYSRAARTTTGKSTLDWWCDKMGLQMGERIRIVVHGHVVAFCDDCQ